MKNKTKNKKMIMKNKEWQLASSLRYNHSNYAKTNIR